jgi:hypothetical protein
MYKYINRRKTYTKKAALLFGGNLRYKNVTVIITKWFTVTMHPCLKWQCIFSSCTEMFSFLYHRQYFYKTNQWLWHIHMYKYINSHLHTKSLSLSLSRSRSRSIDRINCHVRTFSVDPYRAFFLANAHKRKYLSDVTWPMQEI